MTDRGQLWSSTVDYNPCMQFILSSDNSLVKWYSLFVRDGWRTFPRPEFFLCFFFFSRKAIFLLVAPLLYFVWKVTPVLGVQPFSLPELKNSHQSGSRQANCWSSTFVTYNIYNKSAVWHHVVLPLPRLREEWEWWLLLFRSTNTSRRLMNKLNNPSSWCQPVIDQSVCCMWSYKMRNSTSITHYFKGLPSYVQV